MKLFLLLFTAFLLLALCLWALAAVYRVKKQLLKLQAAMADIKNGNGNRRVLAHPGALTAPLAFELNEIVKTYEARLTELRQTQKTNRQLMTSLSHDVRTPLTTLIGYLDAAQSGTAAGEERDGYVETARRKAYLLKDDIDALFDWFKLNSKEFSLTLEPADLTELTRNLLIDWIPILEREQMNYIAAIPECACRVCLDVDAYQRVLQNLIQNALVHSHADTLELTLVQKEGFAQVTLKDNGVGMAKEAVPHIFERLYQGGGSTGSGLGLAIARQLVEAMGGAIFAESAPGQGAAFTLRFPIAS